MSCLPFMIVVLFFQTNVVKSYGIDLNTVLGPASNESFDEQAARLLRAVRMPLGRLQAIPRLLRDLEQVLQQQWPGCKVMPFGSIVTGLALWDSDLDCNVILPDGDNERTISEAIDVLKQHPLYFIQPISKLSSRVPHIKFIHAHTGIQYDVSFRKPEAIRNSLLQFHLLNLDQRALDLATIVKFWSKLHMLRGEMGKISNYAITLLVIFYLQHVNVLPQVAALQKTPDDIVDQWATSFNKIDYRSANNDSLYELLGGLFSYYDNFDFESNVVSLFTGTAMTRTVFERVDSVPDLFFIYKRNVGQNGLTPLNISTSMCIQGIFVHNYNVVATISSKTFAQFKSVVTNAAKAFAKHRNGFLKALLQRGEMH